MNVYTDTSAGRSPLALQPWFLGPRLGNQPQETQLLD